MDTANKRNLYLGLLAAGTLPLVINGYVNSVVFRWPPVYWALELVYWVAVPAVVFGIAIHRGGFRFAEAGISTQIRGKRNLALLLLLCVVFCPLDFLVYKKLIGFFSGLFPQTPFFSYEDMVPTAGLARQVVAVYFALTAGIIEELYFRGFCFRIATFHAHPILVYLLISPFLFALIHWEGGMANICATYVFGLLQAAAFLAIRNLWPLIAGHVYTDYVWFW